MILTGTPFSSVARIILEGGVGQEKYAVVVVASPSMSLVVDTTGEDEGDTVTDATDTVGDSEKGALVVGEEYVGALDVGSLITKNNSAEGRRVGKTVGPSSRLRSNEMSGSGRSSILLLLSSSDNVDVL